MNTIVYKYITTITLVGTRFLSERTGGIKAVVQNLKNDVSVIEYKILSARNRQDLQAEEVSSECLTAGENERGPWF